MHIQTFFVVATECMDMWRNLNNFRRFDFENFIINLARCNVAIATNTPLILNKKYVHILFTRSSANSIKWTNTVNLCQMYNTTSLKSSLCQTDILKVIFFMSVSYYIWLTSREMIQYFVHDNKTIYI